ncbi:MAG TPA: DUF1559 domain-containing protein [Urbifossiella sp.]|nr:DUF1559 domain-containing protein [Urbifossiella sp.]
MFARYQVALLAAAVLGGLSAIAAPAPKGPPEPKIALFDEAKPANGNGARERRTSLNNLKQIALSVHNYESAYGKLPVNSSDKDGKPLLSWRVLILPYIEQNNLYLQFKHDEPWDSLDNVKLLEKMPRVFESPRVTAKKGYTVYQGFTGNGALFTKPLTLGQVPDGASTTILCVEATRAVPWTKPSDIPFDPEKDLPKFGKAFGEKPLAALCDGSTRTLDLKTLTAETLKHAICTNDGFPLGSDW